MMRGMYYVIICAFVTVIIGSAMPPGLDTIWDMTFPMTGALNEIFHQNDNSYFDLLALPGLYFALEATAFAYGRVLFSLARAGLLPQRIGKVNSSSAPINSLLLGAILGIPLCFIMVADEGDPDGVGHVFVFDLTIIAGSLHLGFIIASFVAFRWRCPQVRKEGKKEEALS